VQIYSSIYYKDHTRSTQYKSQANCRPNLTTVPWTQDKNYINYADKR